MSWNIKTPGDYINGPLTVAGSATITGDLMVDTSTLKVDSANDRVGVNTASPINTLHVNGEVTLPINNLQYWNAYYSGGFKSLASGYAGYTAFATNGDFVLANTNASAAGAGSALSFYNRYRISNSGIHTWEYVGGVAGTAMTLNATGLGVGDAPTADCKLTVRGGAFINRGAAGGASQLLVSLAASSGGNFGQISNTGTRWALGYGSTLTTVGTEALIWDSSGNVGIGVAGPNYRLQANVATGGDRNIFAAQVTGASSGFTVQWNNGTQKLRVNFSDLPTSSAGLPANTLWVDTAAGNTLKLA